MTVIELKVPAIPLRVSKKRAEDAIELQGAQRPVVLESNPLAVGPALDAAHRRKRIRKRW